MDTVYETIVGMEIHVELKTRAKMFCGCKNDPFHAPKPNIYTCPVCLGMPGGLPVPNKKAIEWTIQLGLALGSDIHEFFKFDRKNYFYPDLAKGYQISQYDQPIATGGIVKTSTGDVRIHRIHLEEDTGKLQHTTIDGKKVSLIDFNRSGVPLVEIVTEPDIHSGDQAKEFLKKLHQVITFLGISDAEMEKGSMRLEPNISVRPVGASSLPSYKVEVKNINSFHFVKQAIDFETERHIQHLEHGESHLLVQETRGWDEDTKTTFLQRRKETADDYRYFPEPDIPPIRFTASEITSLKSQIPTMPDEIISRYVALGLTQQVAESVALTGKRAAFFDTLIDLAQKQKSTLSPKTIADWVINKKADESGESPDNILKDIIATKTVIAVDPDILDAAIAKVLAEQPKAVADYKAGKEQSLMFLFGQVLKELQGKGDKAQILEQLKRFLAES